MSGSIHRSNPQIGFGSIVITLLNAPYTTYECESFTPTAKVEIVRRKDHLNRPNGLVQVEQETDATGVAQLATASTPRLKAGDMFADDGKTYVVGEVSVPKEQNGIWKQNFNATENV